jgi:uncharacterized protein
MDKQQILSALTHLKSELSSRGILEIGLFGSFANDSSNAYSDIDVAIRKDKAYMLSHSPYYYFDLVEQIKSHLSSKLGRKADVFDLDSASPFGASIASEVIYV